MEYNAKENHPKLQYRGFATTVHTSTPLACVICCVSKTRHFYKPVNVCGFLLKIYIVSMVSLVLTSDIKATAHIRSRLIIILILAN